MGATVSTGKQAFAFTATDSGETIYVLHEAAYEKNVFPHTPRWSCISIGPIATVLRRIFGMAANCVSGDLQVRGGRSAPEQYIAVWLKQLACPLQQEDQPVQLRIAKGWDQSIPADDAPKVLAHLVANGRSELAQALQAGLCFLSTLHAESKLVHLHLKRQRFLRNPEKGRFGCPSRTGANVGVMCDPVDGWVMTRFGDEPPFVVHTDNWHQAFKRNDGLREAALEVCVAAPCIVSHRRGDTHADFP